MNTSQRIEREQMRLLAGRMFARGLRQKDVVVRFGVAKSTASKWYQLWREGGRAALRRRKPPGRPRRLSEAEIAQLGDELQKGPQAHGHATDLWTLPRIAQLIEKQLGVRYHPGHVWWLLRRMGWTCQKPARRAKERDEDAIRRWRKQRWPALKRGRCAEVN